MRVPIRLSAIGRFLLPHRKNRCLRTHLWVIVSVQKHCQGRPQTLNSVLGAVVGRRPREAPFPLAFALE